VPNRYLGEPWTMPEEVQRAAGCVIGADYPEPIVDHAEARRAALDRYRA
jgi:deoxyribodipyrimidine photolyase